MEFTKETSYAKQIQLLLGARDYARASEVALECIKKFPDFLPGYLLHARAALLANQYERAELSARHAFNKASGADLEPATKVLLLVLFTKKEYGQAIKLYELVTVKKLAASQELDLLYGIILTANGDTKKGTEILKGLGSEFVSPFLESILRAGFE